MFGGFKRIVEFEDIIPAFARTTEENNENPQISRYLAEIRTKYLPKTSHKTKY